MAEDENYMLRDLLELLIKSDGTDLIICTGKAPQVRVNKDLRDLNFPKLSAEKSKDLCYQVMNDLQQKKLEENWEVDFSFGVPSLARFRANVFTQRGVISGAFRRIPFKMMTFDELNLPPVIQEISDKPNGLVLVTGPTGSGKSTTLATMIDRINENRNSHIITIEDPIEYLHGHRNCTVEQREIGTDSKSFSSALKSILRQDPDVVLLGEMRDPESIQAALTIAETGHLCFATLHTNSCAQTLSRIIDVFPGEKQAQVRTQLAQTLIGVLTQALLPRVGGGLHLVLEIMIATSAIRAQIRENKVHSINNQISTGSKFGMQTMNQSLATAVKNDMIREEDAMAVSPDLEEFRKCMTF